MKPRLFIGSSAEHLDLAYAAQESLEHDVEATVWSQDMFSLTRPALASLLDELDDFDFGLFILAPDDVVTIRANVQSAVRDNVIFELGLFMGRLGPDRCFLIAPRGTDDLRLPSDLAGITPAPFDADRQDGNMLAALGPACNRVRKAVQRTGPISREAASMTQAAVAAEQEAARAEELTSDPQDCIALIQSWMGGRPAKDNLRAIRYDDVDRDLKLAPGSARAYLEQAATKYRYEPETKGKDIILFKQRPPPPLRLTRF